MIMSGPQMAEAQMASMSVIHWLTPRLVSSSFAETSCAALRRLVIASSTAANSFRRSFKATDLAGRFAGGFLAAGFFVDLARGLRVCFVALRVLAIVLLW